MKAAAHLFTWALALGLPTDCFPRPWGYARMRPQRLPSMSQAKARRIRRRAR